MRHLLFLLALLVYSVLADVYMHNPRGSNNRLNSVGQQTRNADRLFDSQNNNNGGYNVGPSMFYYSKSLLQVEWTAQHGCGNGHENTDCNLVLQYMCRPKVRDGDFDEDQENFSTNQLTADPDRKTTSDTYFYGQHESPDFFAACNLRERNKGLFTADRNLNNNRGARATRQNNNGNQNGFECPEERDYFPYWHPSPWKDIAIITSNTDRCKYYQKNSQNVKGKGYCSDPSSSWSFNRKDSTLPPFDGVFDEFNNREACETANGKWRVMPSWDLPPPECLPGTYSRDNHLGNSEGDNTARYLWVLPSISNSEEDAYSKCVIRLRYNVSSFDYAPWAEVDGGIKIDASFNREKSPVKNNPDELFMGWNYTMAIDTSQFGRTFEDRSHVFSIRSRSGTGIEPNARIYNLNVRGKRGNIVEAYPAVEYDFVPTRLTIKVKDYVHFQWTGSDRNPQNYAGEGRAGTDRSNIVQLNKNVGRKNKLQPGTQEDTPTSENVDTQGMFDDETAHLFAHVGQPENYCTSDTQTDCCKTTEQLQNSNNRDQDLQNCRKLNAGSAYFNHAPIQFSKTGKYNYYSTRNNNFTNRSQKGTLVVEPHLGWLAVTAVVIGAIAFFAALVIAGGVWYSMSRPGSSCANIFQIV